MKAFLPLLVASMLCSSCSPLSSTPAAPIQDPANVAFGYSDKSGTKLLALPELDAARARTLVEAVCREGQVLSIRYVGMQAASSASNGRQSAYNFENEGGPLFEVLTGQAEVDDTCMLVPAGYTTAFPVAANAFGKSEREAQQHAHWQAFSTAEKLKQPADISAFHAPTDFAKKSLAALAAAKGRAVTLYWLLYRSGPAQEVAAVEFAPDADHLLGSLVLVEAGRLTFLDMPASLEKGRADGGCWRVDDDCRFAADGMSVPAVLGAPGNQLIFVTLSGAEGQLLKLLQVKDGRLVELKDAYRYLAPV